MKRRKKGGGYDLRKSIAWDRAFFTDEGVLNPFELSMISGTSGNSYGEPLSIINEEGRSSLSGDSNRTTNAVESQTFEGTFNTTLNKHSMKSGCLLPRHDSSAQDSMAQTSVATRKVISIHGGSRTASKGGGCPRPVASSSLKMPENVNSGKATKKESKLPKIPVSKPGPCSLSTTTRSTILSASHLKHNQIAQPVVNGQKSGGLKNSSQNVKSAQNKAKAGPDCLPSPAKFSAQRYRRNLANSQLEEHLLDNPRKPLVNKANSGLEVIRGSITPSTKVHSSEGQDRSTIIAAPSSLNTCIIRGNIQYAETQTVKPSGLRMPSPSLRFFGQPKASGSQSLSQKNTQSYSFSESSILGQQKLGGLRPPHVPEKVPKIVNDVTTTVSMGDLSSRTQCSALTALNSVSHKIMKLDLELNNVQKEEVKFPYVGKSSDYELSSCKHEVHDIIDAGQKIQEHIVLKEDAELHTNNNQVLLQGGPGEDNKATIISSASKDYSRNDLGNPQFVVGATGTKCTVEHYHEEDAWQNYSVINHNVISTSQSGDSISHGEQNSSRAYDDWVRCMQDIDQSSREQAKLRQPCTNEADQVSFGDIHSLKRKHGVGKLFGESQKYETEVKANFGFKTSEHSGSELKNVYAPYECDTEQDSEAASGVDNLTNKSHVGDAKLQAPNQILSVGNYNSSLSTSAEHQCLKVCDLSEQPGEKVDDSCEQSREHLESHSIYLAVDQSFPYNTELHCDDYFLLAKRSFSEKSQGEEVIESVQCVPERSDVSISELNGSNVIITHVPGRMQDGGVDIDQMAEQPPVEAQLHSVEIAPSVGNHKCSIDTQVRHDIKLIDEATFMEFDESLGKELELLAPSAQTMLYGSNLKSIGLDGLKNDLLVEEAETNSFLEEYQKGQRREISGGSLFGESVVVEESQKQYLENIADASSIVKDHTGSGLGSSHTPSQFRNAEQAHEGAGGGDNMTNKSHVGDAQVQLLDGNVLVGDCSRHISPVHDQYLNIVEYNEQFGEQPELPNSRIVVEQVSEDDRQLHLRDYSSPQKNTKGFRQKNIFESVVDAVPEQSNVCASDIISSNAIAQVSPAVKESGFDLDKTDDQPHLEDAPSASVGIESSAKYHEYFTERQFRPNMESSGQAISSEFESALKRSRYQDTGVISTCSEKLGLLVKGDQSSSRSSQVDIGVDELMRIFPDETENKTGELRHEMENGRCLAKDKDAIQPVTENSTKQDNLMIKPPPNAIPFSDEWLAAIEAAGEDILTMKSGAVTNSPPDKSVPEPGPWSPVKRKNNQIGPFDCTKFTNTLPADSH